eukprot:1246696-Amphidinium_carterae.1
MADEHSSCVRILHQWFFTEVLWLAHLLLISEGSRIGKLSFYGAGMLLCDVAQSYIWAACTHAGAQLDTRWLEGSWTRSLTHSFSSVCMDIIEWIARRLHSHAGAYFLHRLAQVSMQREVHWEDIV